LQASWWSLRAKALFYMYPMSTPRPGVHACDCASTCVSVCVWVSVWVPLLHIHPPRVCLCLCVCFCVRACFVCVCLRMRVRVPLLFIPPSPAPVGRRYSRGIPVGRRYELERARFGRPFALGLCALIPIIRTRVSIVHWLICD
jgi:hypothetical protein